MSESLTYHIEFTDREPMRVTIPASWKITFGAVVPGKGGGAQYGSFGLRIWEATDKQRAVFPNVTRFYVVGNDAMQYLVAAVRKYGTNEWYRDTLGPEWSDRVERAWMPEPEVLTQKPEWLTDWRTMPVSRTTPPKEF